MGSFVRSCLAIVAIVVPTTASATDFVFDAAHTYAHFSVRHMMVSSVRGDFSDVTGTLMLDDKDVTKSKVQAEIGVASIDTHEPKRDAHLKSPDFFDAKKFPKITFTSTKVAKAGKGKLKVTGDLTIHGVTKPVVLDVDFDGKQIKDPWGNVKAGATATTTINRQDFGVSWNKSLDAGGVVVGDEVKITLDVELNKVKPETAKK